MDDTDILLAEWVGRGIGAEFGARVEDALEYAEGRTVLFSLVIDASDTFLGCADTILDDPNTDDLALVDRERREEDSEGAGRDLVAISLLLAC